jgi:hypothetical protein
MARNGAINGRRGTDIIRALLDGATDDLLARWVGDPKPLLEEMGVIFSETAAEVFDAVYGDEWPHVVVEGPRGGGKTFLITLALGCRFLFRRDDVFHLGGSEEQAKNGFRYISEFLTGQPRFEEFVEDDLKTAATTRWGNWYKIAACSGKRVRGPHAGDPHREMGYVAHGGCCYTDEEAEIPDEIVDAMRFVINTAQPRKRVRSSTAHKVGGRFRQVTSNPGRFAAKLIKFDIIDVAERCGHDCSRCPMGYYFAGPLFGAKAIRRGTGGQAGVVLPAVTRSSLAGWEDWKRANDFPAHEPAMCEGRAKLHRPGHKTMDSLFEEVRESQCRTSDEVEIFGRNRAAGSAVLSGALLERCLDPDAGYEAGGEVLACVDWGWNWSVIAAVQQQRNRLAVLEVQFSRHELIEELEERFRHLRQAYGVWRVTADASHKRENEHVRSWGFQVSEVPFAQLKDFGVRWVKGVVERGQMAIPGEILHGKDPVGQDGKYRFGSEGHKKFFDQCLGWHTGVDGRIVKKNDHGPDAFLTLSVLLARGVPAWSGKIEGVGSRSGVFDHGR